MIGALRGRGVRENDASEMWKTRSLASGATGWQRVAALVRCAHGQAQAARDRGGGPAAIEAALAVRRLAEERVAITLLSASEQFVYRPLSVGTPFGAGEPLR